MTSATVAFTMFASAVLAAPAPFPKEWMTKEQEALYREAEKYREAADRLGEQLRERPQERVEFAKKIEEQMGLNRRAAALYSRLNADYRSPPNFQN